MPTTPFPGQPVRGSATGRPVMALFDLLGRPWSMGIVWQLADGPLSFRDLRAACDDVSPSTLNGRLKELRATGFVDLDDAGYHLTELGEQLFARIEPLGRWAKRWARELTGEEWS